MNITINDLSHIEYAISAFDVVISGFIVLFKLFTLSPLYIHESY